MGAASAAPLFWVGVNMKPQMQGHWRWLFVAAVVVPVWIVAAIVTAYGYMNPKQYTMTVTFEPVAPWFAQANSEGLK